MDRSICAECGRRPSLFICFCAQTELCSGCLSVHITRKPGVFHQTVPLDSGALVQEMKAQEGQKQDLERRKEELRAELERVEGLQEKALEELELVKRQWVEEIEKATAQIAALVRERCEEVTSQLQASLSHLDLDPAPSLDSLELPSLDLSSLLASLQPQGQSQCTLYKFFGGQNWVGLFDTHGERMAEIRHTEERFLHNACWAVDDHGDVYVTGGSLMGSSRKDVFSYNPASNQLSRQASLCTARRSHTSLVLSSTLYVFGGLENESKLQAAESLLLGSSSRWEALPRLTYARAYLGCASYKGAVFLAGGCAEAAMEVYLPKTNTYICFMLNVELSQACSLLALDHSILIFHGNSQIQVLEYHPETGSAELLGETGHGSVWSGCSPVLSEGKVYMLRLDSVVAYGLDSRKSSFVGRFGRQRRSEGEQEDLRRL